ncbi:dihydroneopterin aldolase [Anaerovibrio sp. RM50]|uniref:dihydroneopterin aldolase n=1 Tax=Anaerovibrio sp. RM50 TaxID=1200557 RepID=UPI00048760BC|nr:dihydroneopterin aldolase [Anaerovibrio sp. RM50]
MTDSIYLEGMEFFGRHGVLPEEQRLGQRFIVDLAMELDLHEAGITDDLAATVNYAEVFAKVKEIVEGVPFKLLEYLADRIAKAVFEGFPLVDGLEITIHKPGAPIPGVFKDVGVKIRRQRREYI